MSPVQVHCREASASDESDVEITEAAIGSYRRLLHAVGGGIMLHASRDGGLLCEDRRSRARPTVWRIAPDGAVVPDRPYSFTRRAFVGAQLPPVVT